MDKSPTTSGSESDGERDEESRKVGRDRDAGDGKAKGATRKPSRAKKSEARADASEDASKDGAVATDEVVEPGPAKDSAAAKSKARDVDGKPIADEKPIAEAEDDEESADDGEDEDDDDDAEEAAASDDEDAADSDRPPAPRPRKLRPKLEEPPKRRRGRDIIGVLVCVAVVLFARASLADHYVVPTGSMEPTVAVGDRVVVSKAAYGLRVPLTDFWVVRWGGPKRGDVVVLESPEGGTILLKRVVGLPGDTISVRQGTISVNGQKMPIEGSVENLEGKHHSISLESGGGPEWGPTKLPPEKYLVMGDNRGNSRDGRFFGLVDESAILGHAVRIYYSGGSFSWKDL